MKILVANLGSTSFKYRLFDMAGGGQLARGGIERIGSPESRCFVEIGDRRQEKVLQVPDHAEAVRQCLAQLTDPEAGCLKAASEVSAIGLKAVHGGRVSGVRRVTPEVLDAMAEVNVAAPAHNPPYIAAMRLLSEQLPEIPLVAAFETDFHQTIPERNRCYAVPYEWAEGGLIRRFGFHGASHQYISWRTPQLTGIKSPRIVSCHLGGSSSLCAIKDGKSVGTTMGFSPQTGLPQGTRTGDIDAYAIRHVMRLTGRSLDEVLAELSANSGLAGLSGTGGDLRDIANAADEGDARAKLALDVYVTAIRHALGAYLVELGGADVIVFTGGIGQNRVELRQAVCKDLAALGVVLDEEKNASASGTGDTRIDDTQRSRVQIWVTATNEELIVARRAAAALRE